MCENWTDATFKVLLESLLEGLADDWWEGLDDKFRDTATIDQLLESFQDRFRNPDGMLFLRQQWNSMKWDGTSSLDAHLRKMLQLARNLGIVGSELRWGLVWSMPQNIRSPL